MFNFRSRVLIKSGEKKKNYIKYTVDYNCANNLIIKHTYDSFDSMIHVNTLTSVEFFNPGEENRKA